MAVWNQITFLFCKISRELQNGMKFFPGFAECQQFVNDDVIVIIIAFSSIFSLSMPTSVISIEFKSNATNGLLLWNGQVSFCKVCLR